MIEITGHRDKDGKRFLNPYRSEAPNKALDFFVDELKFGAIIIDIKDGANMVSVTTRVSFMGCTDVFKFEGPSDEMRFIVILAGYHSMAASKSIAAKMAADLINKKLSTNKQGNNPLLLSFFVNQTTGETLLRLSAMLAAGITEDADLELAAKENFKDIIAAAQLAHEGACSFREALTL